MRQAIKGTSNAGTSCEEVMARAEGRWDRRTMAGERYWDKRSQSTGGRTEKPSLSIAGWMNVGAMNWKLSLVLACLAFAGCESLSDATQNVRDKVAARDEGRTKTYAAPSRAAYEAVRIAANQM